MADYEFKYSPLTGRLTGKQMIEQTEQAINALASQVDSAAGQVEIISTLANEANENAATALETAEEALATTGRTYITVSIPANANDYYDSQLIYIADNTSTNIPVEDTGMLEAKTNDSKTACEQCFVADSSGASYYRHGDITAETVGDVTTYTVTWGGWSSEPASQAYVQGELASYLPLSGGTVTGGLTVEGTITGNLTGNVTGNADTATNAVNATNDANGNPITSTYLPVSGGTLTGALNTANNTWNNLGDDAAFGDHNVAGKMCVKTQTSTDTGIAFFNSSDTNVGQVEVNNAFNFNKAIKQNGIDLTPQTASTNNTSSDVSVPNNTAKNLLSFSLTAGTWLVQAVAQFPTNSTGYRRIVLADNSTGGNRNRFSNMCVQAANGLATALSLTTIISVSSTTTIYLNVTQTSGGSLNVSGGVEKFRLSADV